MSDVSSLQFSDIHKEDWFQKRENKKDWNFKWQTKEKSCLDSCVEKTQRVETLDCVWNFGFQNGFGHNKF